MRRFPIVQKHFDHAAVEGGDAGGFVHTNAFGEAIVDKIARRSCDRVGFGLSGPRRTISSNSWESLNRSSVWLTSCAWRVSRTSRMPRLRHW